MGLWVVRLLKDLYHKGTVRNHDSMLSLKALEFLCQGRQELGEALERVQSFSHKRLQMAEFPEIMDSILAPSGKGLRALLCLMVGHGWSCPLDQSFITVAAALETLHLASLQHDDVIDQSSWRRGQMSTPKRWGNKTAVLMGDYLLSQTLGLILDLDSQAYLQHFYRMARTLTLGQLAEIHYQGLTQSLDRYTQTLAEKTSALFQGACACSGTLVQADSKAQQALDTYGYHLGIAFQLHDDWLDYQGCSQTLGKKIGQDFQEKRTQKRCIVGCFARSKASRRIPGSWQSSQRHLFVRVSTI